MNATTTKAEPNSVQMGYPQIPQVANTAFPKTVRKKERAHAKPKVGQSVKRQPSGTFIEANDLRHELAPQQPGSAPPRPRQQPVPRPIFAEMKPSTSAANRPVSYEDLMAVKKELAYLIETVLARGIQPPPPQPQPRPVANQPLMIDENSATSSRSNVDEMVKKIQKKARKNHKAKEGIKKQKPSPRKQSQPVAVVHQKKQEVPRMIAPGAKINETFDGSLPHPSTIANSTFTSKTAGGKLPILMVFAPSIDGFAKFDFNQLVEIATAGGATVVTSMSDIPQGRFTWDLAPLAVLITDCPNNSLLYLWAVGFGCRVLYPTWMIECANAQRILPHDNFTMTHGFDLYKRPLFQLDKKQVEKIFFFSMKFYWSLFIIFLSHYEVCKLPFSTMELAMAWIVSKFWPFLGPTPSY